MLSAAFRSLVVNLVFLNRFAPDGRPPLVLVDSWREALFLRSLVAARVIPRCRVRVIVHRHSLSECARIGTEEGRTLVLTMRVCARHYQAVAELRRRGGVLVI